MPIIKICIILFVSLAFLAKPDLQKCTSKGNTTHYFDKSDKKAKDQCITAPKTVLKNTKTQQTKKSLATNQSNCAGSGGIVRVNGKLFHLDAAELCRRYGLNNKGRIKKGTQTTTKHIKLHHINQAFREKFSSYINQAAKKNKLEPAFVHAIISTESAYKPNATSRSGAMGLMQLMPMTAKRFKVKNAYDPYQNINAGVKYLRILLNEFGTLELAAAGYNAGEGSVRKYNRTIPPYKETMAYVPKVMAFYRQYKEKSRLISPNQTK